MEVKLLRGASDRSPSTSPRNQGRKKQTNKNEWFLPWCFLSLGLVLGHFHGRFYDSEYHHHHHPVPWQIPVLGPSSNAVSCDESQTRKETIRATVAASTTHNDADIGWTSIQVFYGKRRDIVDDESTTTNATTATYASREQKESQRKKEKWFSQAAQDQVVSALLKEKRGGYFVDLAANDAIHLSNSYALERSFGWRGLCIEANQIYSYNLTHYRSCQTVAAVVGTERMQPVHFRYVANEHGGIAGTGFDNGPRWKRESSLAYTVPLEEILHRNSAPTIIDYLSLDVEGAESFIMLNFSFDVYKFRVITAERLRADLRSRLEENGYQFVKRLTKWGETLWVETLWCVKRSAVKRSGARNLG